MVCPNLNTYILYSFRGSKYLYVLVFRLIFVLLVLDITSPKDLGYIKQIAISLNRIALWPITESTKRSIFYILLEVILLSLQAAYARNNKDTLSFLEMGHTYVTLAICCICLQRLTMPWISDYREVTKDFLSKIHLYYHKNKSEYAMKVYSQVENICTFFTLIIHYQMYTGIVLFSVTPWYKNLKAGMFSFDKPTNGTYEHSMYLELPFDYLTNFTGYIFVFILGWIQTYAAASILFLGDLYLSLIVFHIWGHLKILKHSLESFPKPKNQQLRNNEMYTKEESEQVSILIKEIVNHHRLIMETILELSRTKKYFLNRFVNDRVLRNLSFMTKISNAYSVFLATYLAFHQFVECILLLKCSELQLIQISVIFELIGSQSETLIDSVYGLPWECMGLKNRKLVLFFLQNVREPMTLKACGMVSIGVKTMASIIKASCSYFIMLRTFTTNEEMASV